MASRDALPVQLVDLGKKLLEAARRGDRLEVHELLKKGASFTTDWLGVSPLHLAAQNGHLETALLLMRAGMSWDARTKVSKTPLHLATQSGHIDLVKAFIQQGADLNAKDIIKMTPLHWAAEKNLPEIAELLISGGADIDITNKFDKTPRDICIEKGFDNVLVKLNAPKRSSEHPCSSDEITELNESTKAYDLMSTNMLSSLSSLIGMSQDNQMSDVVSIDDLALLQSSVNLASMPIENIKAIVLTDAGRLALQLLNKGLDNVLVQPNEKNSDNSDDELKNSITYSQVDQNPEQYLTSSSATISPVAKFSKSGCKDTVTDIFPTSSSIQEVPFSPVFPELRSSGIEEENYEISFDKDILQIQNESDQPNTSMNDTIMSNTNSSVLQVLLGQPSVKKS